MNKCPVFKPRVGLLGTMVNEDMFDEFTLLHYFSGYLLGNRTNLNLGLVMIGGILWDWAIERELKCRMPKIFPNPSQDSGTHVLVDFAVYSWGAANGRRSRGI